MIRNILDHRKAQERDFMEQVERHERAWGSRNYKGRPSLKHFMEAKVVAFWHPTDPGMPFTATIHNSIEDINSYLTYMVIHGVQGEMPRLRLANVFINKARVKIKAVQIVYEEVELK